MEEPDAEWGRAIELYINPQLPRKPNAAPLADLLQSDKPIPQDVRSLLADIIRPVQRIRPNYRIKLIHTGAFDRFWERGLRSQSIALAVANEVESGKTVDEASAIVADQLLQWRPKIKMAAGTVKDLFEDFNNAHQKLGLNRIKRGIKKNRDVFGAAFRP
jgi:hypothetical protein